MTPVELTTLVGAGCTLAGIGIAKLVELRGLSNARRSRDQDATAIADAERVARDAALFTGIERLCTTIQGALDAALARSDAALHDTLAAQSAHTGCLELVEKVQAQATADRERCATENAEMAARIAVLERRTGTSDPAMVAVKTSVEVK